MISDSRNTRYTLPDETMPRSVTPYKTETNKVKLARRILGRASERLKRRFYDLSFAISSMEFVPVKEKVLMETDGERLYFNPEMVLSSHNLHRTDKIENEIVHIILHGILGHFEMDGKYKNYKFAWSIMDEQVRCMSFKLYDKAERSRAPEMSLYYSIKGRNNIKKWCVSHVPGNDNHYLWSMNKQDKEENKQGAQGGAAKKGSSEKTAEGVRKKWSEIRGVMGMKKDGDSQENLARFESIVNGQDGFGDSAGDSAGDSECDYEFTDDPVMDYTELLKKLCRECERVHEDADSFDTMLYNYGLEMYGDVPLIEPLETKEEPHFNTLVLAIDTSGSCDGGVAQRFVTETGSIFFDIAHMAEIDHLYLLQCDAEIQSEIRFDGAAEVAGYCRCENVRLKGFGGTDFCPVFERVDELVKDGETVDALIYLTDGCGCYPFEKPDYPVYFVVNVEDMDEDFDEDFDCFGGPEWIKFVKMS